MLFFKSMLSKKVYYLGTLQTNSPLVSEYDFIIGISFIFYSYIPFPITVKLFEVVLQLIAYSAGIPYLFSLAGRGLGAPLKGKTKPRKDVQCNSICTWHQYHR